MARRRVLARRRSSTASVRARQRNSSHSIVPSINAVGDVNRDEVIGAEAFCKLHGVAFVSFDAVTGFDRDERGRDDITAHAHLEKSPGDPKSASARFIANVEVGEFPVLLFGNTTYGALQGKLGSGDVAVVAGFGITVGFEDGDDSFCFMDVESEIECLRCA